MQVSKSIKGYNHQGRQRKKCNCLLFQSDLKAKSVCLYFWESFFSLVVFKTKAFERLSGSRGVAMTSFSCNILNNYPVLSVLVVLLCLMPFFDAYAPTSYISIEYLPFAFVFISHFFQKRKPDLPYGLADTRDIVSLQMHLPIYLLNLLSSQGSGSCQFIPVLLCFHIPFLQKAE